MNNNDKHWNVKSLLQNGDICEFKTWDGNVYFCFYMDGYFYRDQLNNVICQIVGCESQVVAVRRPRSLRNAFDCFKNGDLYNYDISKYGAFDTIFSENIDDFKNR